LGRFIVNYSDEKGEPACEIIFAGGFEKALELFAQTHPKNCPIAAILVHPLEYPRPLPLL